MIRCERMGQMPDGGQSVYRYTLQNASGARAEIATLGGCWLSMCVPDGKGRFGDVLLGYATLESLLTGRGYMGKIVGRFANRIAGASFSLGGKTYALARNNGENHLHGGWRGFDAYVWEAQTEGDALVLHRTSPDGEEGYPGTLDVQVTYRLGEDNALSIAYEATCDQDTPLNLTNHAYFNLSGPDHPSIVNHVVRIDADAITPVTDAGCIPTGRLMPVEGTPFDLRVPRRIGEGLSYQQTNAQMGFGNGYDHNYVLNRWDGSLRAVATVWDHASGRRMDVATDQPGMQFYTGNGIHGDTPGKAGRPYVPRQGFCLETQYFPDSVHHPAFPSCVLRAGEIYRTQTVYRFGLA